MSQMYYVTCEKHPDLRWLVKGIALNRNGRYNGARNLHFMGCHKPTKDYPFHHENIVDGRLVKECPCDSSLLTVAPESIDEFQRTELPTDDEMKEIHDRLKPKPASPSRDMDPEAFITFCKEWLAAHKENLVATDDQHCHIPMDDASKVVKVFTSYTSTHLEIIWDG